MIVDMMNDLSQIHSMFWNKSIFVSVYVLCFIFIFFSFKRNEKALDSLGIYSLLIFIFVAYNPLVCYILLNYIIDDVGVPIRVFLIIPLFAVVAFVFTEIVYETKNKCYKIGLFLGFGILICLGGKSFYENKDFKIPTNIYKIDQEVIEVNDIIEQYYGDLDSIGIVYQTDGTPVLDYWARRDDNLIEGLRQYNARLEILHEFYDLESYKMDGYQGLENYVDDINNLNYRVIITGKMDEFNDDMMKLGYGEIGRTENYVVYKRMG